MNSKQFAQWINIDQRIKKNLSFLLFSATLGDFGEVRRIIFSRRLTPKCTEFRREIQSCREAAPVFNLFEKLA